jgi:hypothetical protein
VAILIVSEYSLSIIIIKITLSCYLSLLRSVYHLKSYFELFNGHLKVKNKLSSISILGSHLAHQLKFFALYSEEGALIEGDIEVKFL